MRYEIRGQSGLVHGDGIAVCGAWDKDFGFDDYRFGHHNQRWLVFYHFL